MHTFYFSRLFARLLAIGTVLSLLLMGTAAALAAPLQTAPVNDDFDSAIVVDPTTAATAPNYYQDSTTVPDSDLATPTISDPDNDDPILTQCGYGNPARYSVWWKYTATATGELKVDTAGSGGGALDTILAVWTGTRGSLTAIACNDDYNNTFQSEIRFPVTNGVTYYFEVAKFTQTGGAALGDASALTATDLILNVRTITTTAAPSIPVPLLPANNALLYDLQPTLDWSNSAMSGDTYFYRYEVQLSTSSIFSTLVLTGYAWTLLNSEFPLPSELTANTKYYWRVRACKTYAKCSGWSSVYSFREALLPPTLLSPPKDSVNAINNRRPTFDWADVIGATSFNIQVSNSSGFAYLYVNATVVPSTFTPTADLPANVNLFWRVRANVAAGGNGPSAWSEVWYFKTPYTPSVPVLVSPATNTIIPNTVYPNYMPLLNWNDFVPGVGGTLINYYQVQIDDNSDFSSPFLDVGTLNNTSSYQLAAPLDPNTKYYWRVQAWDTATPNNHSAWSFPWILKAAILPPSLTAPTDTVNVATRRPVFDWSDVTGNNGYNVQVSTSATTNTTGAFVSLTLNVNTLLAAGSTYTPTVDLPANTTLYWHVRTNVVYLGNGPSGWSSTFSFHTPNPPSIPVLVSPVNTALISDLTPTLNWNNSTVPLGTTFDHYQVQLANDINFTTGVMSFDTTAGVLTESEYTLTSPLTDNTKYYWHVRSYDTGFNYSAWSATWYFREMIAAPSLLAPTDGQALATLKPAFDWSDVTGNNGYNLQVSTVTTFASLSLNVNTAAGVSTYTPTVNLPAGKQLYWRVRTNVVAGGNGPSPYAPYFSFTTPNGPPTLTAPANTAIVPTVTPLLDWVGQTLPGTATFDYYQVQVTLSTDPTFAAPVVDDTTITDINTTALVSPALTPDTQYIWRVQFFFTNGSPFSTGWSTVWAFKTAIPAPALTAPAEAHTTGDQTPVLDWSDVTGSNGYYLQVSTVNTFASLALSASTAAGVSTYTPAANLPAGVTLYWRVRANAAVGHFGPSAYATGTFATINNPPTPTAPGNAAIVTTSSPLLDWNMPLAGMTVGSAFDHYRVQVATNATTVVGGGFASTVIDDETDTSLLPSAFTVGLSPNTLYYWHVAYFYTSDAGTIATLWSATWNFKTAIDAPLLNSPADTSTTSDLKPPLDWGDVTGAGSYTVQASASPTFNVLLLNNTVVASTFTPLANLPAGTTIYWRVRANAAAGSYGPSAWSATWSFTTP